MIFVIGQNKLIDLFSLSFNKSIFSFHLVHLDIWGPYCTPSHSNAHYFFMIVDDCTKTTWVYLLHRKSEAYQYFLHFHAMVKT